MNGRPVLSPTAFAARDEQTVEPMLAGAELHAADGHVWLHFRIDDPRTPQSLGMSQGQRRLGVRLTTLRVVDFPHRTS